MRLNTILIKAVFNVFPLHFTSETSIIWKLMAGTFQLLELAVLLLMVIQKTIQEGLWWLQWTSMQRMSNAAASFPIAQKCLFNCAC